MAQNCDKNNSNKIVHMCLLYFNKTSVWLQSYSKCSSMKFKENLVMALFSCV